MIWKTGFRLALESGLVCVLAVGICLPGAVQAQSSERPVIYTNKTVFHLPVRIEDRHRTNLREVRLYVKNGASDWVRQEAGKPDIKQFTYRVPQDGEYWFSVATVDQAGQVTPSDVTREPPGLRVMVDTNPPIVELKPTQGPDGKTCIKCVVQDANPDPQNVKLSYQRLDGREQILVQDPATPGLFLVPDAEIWSRPVQVQATDRCGNVTQREFHLQNPVVQAQPQTPPSTAYQPPPSSIETISLRNDAPLMQGSDVPPATPASFAVPQMSGNGQSPPVQSPTSSYEAPPVSAQPPPKPMPPEPTPLPLQESPSAPFGPVASTQGVPSRATPTPMQPAHESRRLLNTTRAVIEYRIDDVGPSGVGKVEIWITGDEGRTWRRLHEDHDRRSPAEVTLPGEGVYGVALVVANGNGFGGTPPKNGEQPNSWIEVDTTSPFVQLREIDPVAKGGKLTIRWTASDQNLSSEPVSLYYRTRRDGPWHAIAVNLPNDGVYEWAFPRDLGPQFFVRIEACDKAGNVARAETNEPVLLDLTEPRASVVNISGHNGGNAP